MRINDNAHFKTECIVEFDYDAEQKDEITLRANDIIKNVKKVPGDGWWEGELNGKRGFFPNNFVKVKIIVLHLYDMYIL